MKEELVKFLKKRLLLRRKLEMENENYYIRKRRGYLMFSSVSVEPLYELIEAIEEARPKRGSIKNLEIYIEGKNNSLDLEKLSRICEATNYNPKKIELIEGVTRGYEKVVSYENPSGNNEKLLPQLLKQHGNLPVRYVLLQGEFPDCIEIRNSGHVTQLYTYKHFPHISAKTLTGIAKLRVIRESPKQLMGYLETLKQITKWMYSEEITQQSPQEVGKEE